MFSIYKLYLFTFSRAKILHLHSDTHSTDDKKDSAFVLLLDEGTVMWAQTSKLFNLPESCSLDLFPPEIIEV